MEDHKRQQDEVNRDSNEVTIGKNGDTGLFKRIKGSWNVIWNCA